eukprot:scaffold143_cov173-Ochromonas_danica.AAC.11
MMMWRTSLFLGLTLLVFCSAFSKVPSSDRRKTLLPKTRLVGSNGKALSFGDLQDRVLSGGHDQSLFAVPIRGGEVSSSNNKRPVTLPPHRLSIHQLIYVILTATFVTCLIVADVIGVKIFELKLPFPILGHTSVEHTCGMLTFPITFLLGDVINEYYGPAITPAAFNMIFGSAKLMYVASISAYLIGQMLDIWLFGVIKRLTKGKFLWLRATGSTVISQLIDSFVVSYIAFSFGKTVTNQVPATMKEVLNIAITGYGLKFVLAGLITPLLYVVRNFLHDRFGFEPLPVDYQED